MNEKLQFAKLHDQATLPTRGSSNAAGLDLYASEAITIEPRSFAGVHTGVAVAIPHGYYGRVAPRSGLAFKFGIDTLAGVVDSDYRGELVCVLMNNSDQPFAIAPGDRIAQFVIESIITPEPEWVATLPVTERGADGFGSTGV